MNPTQIMLPDPTLYALLADQIAMNRNLLYMTWALIFLMSVLLVLQIFRHIRRFTGMKGADNGSDPLDDATLGQFKTKIDSHERTVLCAASAFKDDVTHKMEMRLNAIDKQLEISRRKDNTMLVILRDLRSFMIYHKMPSRELVPIEGEESDEENRG